MSGSPTANYDIVLVISGAAFERLFRRVGISLAMSQGFHPRPLMTFPDALALGIAGQDEVMDITVAEEIDSEEFRNQLNASCPSGLVISNVRILGDSERKAKIAKSVFEISLQGAGEFAALEAAIETMKPIDREVIVLRHFEQLDNKEVAEVLGVTQKASSIRYIRAITRLRELISDIPQLSENRKGDES